MNNIELINASAGSGKTYNLTAKTVDLIKNGVEPEALMVTTFTNRAAAELRSRIRSELLKNEQTDQSNRINDGLIGTVNSICGYLLKEYALEAGLSPALEIMPEEECAEIFKISVDHIIGCYATEIEPAAKRMELDGRGNKKDWREDVKTIVDLARSNRIGAEQLKMCARCSWERLRTNLGEPVRGDLDNELYEAVQLALKTFAQIELSADDTKKAAATLKDCIKKYENNGLTWCDWVKLSKMKPGKKEKEAQAAIAPVIEIANQVFQHPNLHKDLKLLIEGTFKCAIEALEGFATYKQKNGLMDFTDQETQVLEMAIHNSSFRESFAERIEVLMVDEFQDTSPIQLALFLELNKLVGKSVWVGDPKQAIYGFRGTDAQLMDAMVSQIKKHQVLDCSWRSKENLINFTNAFFSQVFHEKDSDKVCLKIPAERNEKAQGGNLETWYLKSKNINDEALSLANGVRDLLKRSPEINPGDIAVLCRTNAKCIKIAENLESLGMRASVGQGLLLETRECGLALAALRYMNNRYDTVALMEIVQILSDDNSWSAAVSELMTDPKQFMEKWHNEKLLQALYEGRSGIKHWTPLEALEQAISRVGLPQKVKSWKHPDLAISNLDILRKCCQQYMDRCSLHRRAATIDGLINELMNTDRVQANGFGDETVNILTYHSSKGLEWPWVVLTDLDKEIKIEAFGVSIEAAQSFDPLEPLANRTIRYWPWPFGKNKYALIEDRIKKQPLYDSIKEQAIREAQRLLYVGMTRAKDGLVISVRKEVNKKGVSLKTGWLDAMKDSNGDPVLTVDLEIGNHTINDGKTQIPLTILEYEPEKNDQPGLTVDREEYLSADSESSKSYPEARVSPSKLPQTENETGSWNIIESFESRIKIKGKPEMDLLGNAVHAYLGIDTSSFIGEEQLLLAQNILKNWQMNEVIDAGKLVNAGENLSNFVQTFYPEYRVYREWPMTMKNEKGQIMQGWIDMLLESDEGYVIIDHKDYPGGNVEERMKKYIPQMQAYQDAVEKATGKPVKEILLHLPISGLMLQFS